MYSKMPTEFFFQALDGQLLVWPRKYAHSSFSSFSAVFASKGYPFKNICTQITQSKLEVGKDQESIQSSTLPDPGYHMGK